MCARGALTGAVLVQLWQMGLIVWALVCTDWQGTAYMGPSGAMQLGASSASECSTHTGGDKDRQ